MNSNNKMACMQAMMAVNGASTEQVDVSLAGTIDEELRALAATEAAAEMKSRWPDGVVTRSEKRYGEYTSRWTGESERSSRCTVVQVPVEGEFERLVPIFQEEFFSKFLEKREAGERALVNRAAAGTYEDAVIRVLSEIADVDTTSFGEIRGIFSSYSVTETPRFDEVEQFIVEGCADSLIELRQHQMPVADLVKFFLFTQNSEKYKKKLFGQLGWDY